PPRWRRRSGYIRTAPGTHEGTPPRGYSPCRWRRCPSGPGGPRLPRSWVQPHRDVNERRVVMVLNVFRTELQLRLLSNIILYSVQHLRQVALRPGEESAQLLDLPLPDVRDALVSRRIRPDQRVSREAPQHAG